MNEAKFLKNVESEAQQAVYQMAPPLQGYEYVVVSAACVFGESETYIFGSDAKGQIVNWSELDGSFKGQLSHETALSNAGYKIVNG